MAVEAQSPAIAIKYNRLCFSRNTVSHNYVKSGVPYNSSDCTCILAGLSGSPPLPEPNPVDIKVSIVAQSLLYFILKD